jgi:hypothetical protein
MVRDVGTSVKDIGPSSQLRNVLFTGTFSGIGGVVAPGMTASWSDEGSRRVDSLLARADRAPILEPRHARPVNVGGGLIRPVVLGASR